MENLLRNSEQKDAVFVGTPRIEHEDEHEQEDD
jgi:hypothetical protein